MTIKERQKVLLDYEKKNEEIVNDLLVSKLTTEVAVKELNKNLGHTLVQLSEIKITYGK